MSVIIKLKEKDLSLSELTASEFSLVQKEDSNVSDNCKAIRMMIF